MHDRDIVEAFLAQLHISRDTIRHRVEVYLIMCTLVAITAGFWGFVVWLIL